MMDALSRIFDMSDVVAAIAEADEFPVWSAANVEEYFPCESLEVNEAGEIIVTLKHRDSKILITPEHSLYAMSKAIIDSSASVWIINQPKYFQDFVDHHITIRTAGNPIVAEGYGTVGKLQNCLLVTALQRNLISVFHEFRDLNTFFVTDTKRCACFEKDTNHILYECSMANGLYSTYDLEWLGINILNAAPDLMVTQERSNRIHAYIGGTANEAMEHQMALVQESRKAWLIKEEQHLLHEVYVIKIDAQYNLHATLGHMPYSRIKRMILKGLWNGYSFDLRLLKQLVNIKCDICMRAKLADGSHKGNLHSAKIPWKMFSMDITGPFMQASIHENYYQCAIIDTYSKYVWDDYLAAKDEVYKVLSDFCETEITMLRGRNHAVF
jgi:hypothetical protein